MFLLVATWTLPVAASQKLTLAWDRSVDASVTGYKLYYREAAATNFTQVDVGNTNVCTLTGLVETRTYTFYVTCYNAAGLESDPSNSVGYTVPLASLNPRVTQVPGSNAVLSLTLAAVEGRQVVLETSQDVVNWAALITSGLGLPIDCTIEIVPSEPARFFRARLLE